MAQRTEGRLWYNVAPERDSTRALMRCRPPGWWTSRARRTRKHLDRLVEDERLYRVLAAQDFEGPGWERFQDALARSSAR